MLQIPLSCGRVGCFTDWLVRLERKGCIYTNKFKARTITRDKCMNQNSRGVLRSDRSILDPLRLANETFDGLCWESLFRATGTYRVDFSHHDPAHTSVWILPCDLHEARRSRTITQPVRAKVSGQADVHACWAKGLSSTEKNGSQNCGEAVSVDKHL